MEWRTADDSGVLTLGHHPVSLGPGDMDFGGHGRAEHGGEGTYQVLGDDLVVFGVDGEGGVLLGHTLQLLGQLANVDDVGGEGQNEGGQGAGLSARVQVDRVEIVVELGVIAQHALVEDGRDVLAMLAEGRDGLVDQLGLAPCQGHGAGPGGMLIDGCGGFVQRDALRMVACVRFRGRVCVCVG